ncbi:hypothetical protein PTSG_11226 [Salpingoeca rosetta]|uniref:TIR domain-containing protein n=1 Tax=Salpingoeca rosetta (strain ATCC 50818 / BSB-021) TaxID=946362 RepID=F2UST0_SALR5|nr:uncharacterized protein PTSG_11226 [Salpingoeca rosetta]EGD81189.1 hypothetical protein PTSG_11226 [Salpingoeca rosetta]|eukprot:XP_004987724.1 hypothetical protein PTSG_11226 [Salpingoeca rosetta]
MLTSSICTTGKRKPKQRRQHGAEAGFASAQWLLLVLVLCGLGGWALMGEILEVDNVCPSTLFNSSDSGKAIPHFATPFRPPRSNDSDRHDKFRNTTSHVYISLTLIPAAGMTLVISTLITIWRRLASLETAAGETAGEGDGADGADRKPSGSPTNTPAPAKSNERCAPLQGDLSSDPSTNHQRLNQGMATPTSHRQRCDCCCLVPCRAASTTSSLSMDKENGVAGAWKRALTKAVAFGKGFLSMMTWVYTGRDNARKASLPQWLLFACLLGALYTLVTFMASTYPFEDEQPEVLLTIAVVSGVCIVTTAFAGTLQQLHVSFRQRYHFESAPDRDTALARLVTSSTTILIVQLFLWCFMLSYAYATLPCLPRWTKKKGGISDDARYTFGLLSLRFWGTVNLSFHLLFTFVWWLVEVSAGHTSVQRLLRLSASPTSVTTGLIILLNTVIVGGCFSMVFSPQPSILFEDKPQRNVTPLLAGPLTYMFYPLWAVTFLLTFGSAILAALVPGFNKDGEGFAVFISYRHGADDNLAGVLYTGITFQSREYLSETQSLRVFLDVAKLKGGEDWMEGFLQALTTSKVYVPIFSWWRLSESMAAEGEAAPPECVGGSLGTLGGTGRDQDNFLLELIVAYELLEQGHLAAVVPILSGGISGTDSYYCDMLGSTGPKPGGSAEVELCLSDDPLEKTNATAMQVLNNIPGMRQFETAPSYWTPRQIVRRLLDKATHGFVMRAGEEPRILHEDAVTVILDAYRELDVRTPGEDTSHKQ